MTRYEYLGALKDTDSRYKGYPLHFPKWVQKAYECSNTKFGFVYYFKGKNYQYKVVESGYGNDPPANRLTKFFRKAVKK